MKRKIPTLKIETKLWQQGVTHVVGVDEVGRGCLAGPVVAGAVVFKKSHRRIYGIRDSKLLSVKKRQVLRQKIANRAYAWSVGVASVAYINKHGISNATQYAMCCAINRLGIGNHLLIDGNYFTGQWLESDIPADTIVRGDETVYTIAAASIIAKVYRDNLMVNAAQPEDPYDWRNNKGYGTPTHLSALLKCGPSPLHRKMFIKNITSHC